MRKFIFYPFIIVFLFALSCNTTYEAGSVQYSNYRINDKNNDNSTVTSVVKPYGDSVNKLMRTVIGDNDTKLEKSRQLNTLGYFITDAYLEMARQKVNPKADIAFMNSGGIRLPDLAAGPVTQGKIFELMPFDNLMMQLKMKGSLLQEYLDTLAAGEGVIQSGMTMQIVNKTAREVRIGGKPLDPNAEYSVIHSDYVVINTNLLKNIVRSTNGYLLRDALIDYVKYYNSQGKKITVSNTDRISYVN